MIPVLDGFVVKGVLARISWAKIVFLLLAIVLMLVSIDQISESLSGVFLMAQDAQVLLIC